VNEEKRNRSARFICESFIVRRRRTLFLRAAVQYTLTIESALIASKPFGLLFTYSTIESTITLLFFYTMSLNDKLVFPVVAAAAAAVIAPAVLAAAAAHNNEEDARNNQEDASNNNNTNHATLIANDDPDSEEETSRANDKNKEKESSAASDETKPSGAETKPYTASTAANKGPKPATGKKTPTDQKDAAATKKDAAGEKEKSQEESNETKPKAAKQNERKASTTTKTSLKRTAAVRTDGEPLLKKLHAGKQTYEGVPTAELKHGNWPKGWTQRTFARTKGSKQGRTDSYWYSPGSQLELRSLVQVQRFLAAFEKCHDEETAYKASLKKK
jgi:hypothetical protein